MTTVTSPIRDLPPLVIESEWVEEIRRSLPELAGQRRTRFIEQYALPPYDADLLTGTRPMAEYFEETVALRTADGSNAELYAKNVSNWMQGDLSRLMNLDNLSIDEIKVKPRHLAELLNLIDNGTLSNTLAKTVLEEAFATGQEPGKIVDQKGLSQISDSSVVDGAVSQALAENPKAVADFISGKETASRFLVGQVMKLTWARPSRSWCRSWCR